MNALAEESFERYHRELRRYLRNRLRNPNDVEDLASEVYLRLIRLDDKKVVDKPLAYVFGIAAHVLADWRIDTEQQKEMVIIDSETADERAEHCITPDDLADRLNLQQQIDKAMALLPATHQAVILAHKRDGLSYEECAEKLNLSIHTVEKYVTQSKTILRSFTWER